MQSSLKKGTTPYFKSERFSLHSQHEIQNYTIPKIYDTNVRLSIIGDELNYGQETNREHCAFFSK